MAHTDGSQHAAGDQRQGQTDTETQHQRSAQTDLFELQTQQQHGDRCRTRDQSTGQPEHDNLAVADLAVLKTALDFFGMSTLMRILIFVRIRQQNLPDLMRLMVVMIVVMIVVMVMMIFIMRALCV